MATLYITEFSGAEVQHGVLVPVAFAPALAEQTRSISGSSAQSSAVNAATTVIRLHTDAICSIAIGTNPTATTSTMRMAADTTEYFAVPKGQSYKVAAITNT